MTMVGGFDVHRKQITFDYVDTDTGLVRCGEIRPATRKTLRRWLGEHCPDGDAEMAVEGCTGWRYVVEELAAAGAAAHLADPAETAGLRGPKKRAKTARADARLLRTLLLEGRLPESWIPPAHVLEVRALGRLYCALGEERRAWRQRIHAQLFHQGCPPITALLTEAGRDALARAELSATGRQYVDTALRRIDELTAEIDPVRTQLVNFARRQVGCRALQARQYGVGGLCAAIIWAEIGDARRFARSDQLVRFAGTSPKPYLDADMGASTPSGRVDSPQVLATSTMAVSPSNATIASWRCPVAPCTLTLTGAKPLARAAATLPSPPSASGRVLLCAPAAVRPFAKWSATSAAVRLPLNLSGAIRTLMGFYLLGAAGGQRGDRTVSRYQRLTAIPSCAVLTCLRWIRWSPVRLACRGCRRRVAAARRC